MKKLKNVIKRKNTTVTDDTKAAVVKMLVNSMRRSTFFEQMSDDALLTEVICKIGATQNLDSWEYDLMDEFIERYKRLRWPGSYGKDQVKLEMRKRALVTKAIEQSDDKRSREHITNGRKCWCNPKRIKP
jgi:hypothetical protein